MAVSQILRFAVFYLRDAAIRWGMWRYANAFSMATSVCFACAALYVGWTFSGYIKDNAVQEAGASAALYMDSFVASQVQELASKDTLTNEIRDALETILSPASMHRPIVAFRIWKGDTVVFSSERALIGKTFAPSKARERALAGHIGVEFEHPDGDDDEQVRSLNLPVLEVYAPVRLKGTSRVIAVAETYEIAVALANDVWIKQLVCWVSVTVIAAAISLLLFSMIFTGWMERESLSGELSRLRIEGEQRRRLITSAGLKVNEINEHTLRRMESDLQHGLVQNVTLALLRLDPVHWGFCNENGVVLRNATQCVEDIKAIREVLSESIRQMRGFSAAAVPIALAELSPKETMAAAAREHYRRTGLAVEYEFHGMNSRLPLALKGSLYRIVLEGLDGTAGGGPAQLLRGSQANDGIALEFVGRAGGEDKSLKIASLQSRIEALGGSLDVNSAPSGQLALVAALNLKDMGITID